MKFESLPYSPRRFDTLVSSLCFEIDDLKDELTKTQEELDDLRRRYVALQDRSLREAQRTSIQLLMMIAHTKFVPIDGRAVPIPVENSNENPSR